MKNKIERAWNLGKDEGFLDEYNRKYRFTSQEEKEAYVKGYQAGIDSANAYYEQQLVDYPE